MCHQYFILWVVIFLPAVALSQTKTNVDSLQQAARVKPMSKDVIDAHLQLFYYYEYETFDDKRARTYLDTVQKLLEKYPNVEAEVLFNRAAGSYYCLSFNFEDGVRYFQKNVDYYESIGDELNTAVAKFKMANHLQDLGEELGGHAASERIDKEVLPVFIKYKDFYHYCGVLVEELTNYPNKADKKKFRLQADACLSELKKYDDWYNQMYAYNAILEKYYLNGFYTDTEAENLLIKLNETTKHRASSDTYHFAEFWRPAVFLNEKEFDAAISSGLKYLEESKKETTQISQTKDMFNIVSKSYLGKGDLYKALAFKDSVLIYGDKIAAIRHENAAFGLEMRYQAERTKTALKIEQTTKQYLMYGLLLAAVLTTALFYQFRLKTSANKKLSDSYKEIRNQKTQLQLLLRELHHRVKNNLQLISSLMSIQAARMEDEKTKTILRESQQRIESISMIHQRLYRTEDISEMEFGTYVKDLVEKNIWAYRSNHHSLNLDLSIEPNSLTPDEYIPLGLIINELLTNSFKYAFPETEMPELKLHLKSMNHKKHALIYADNGKGISDTELNKSVSFGLTLIKLLSNQLGGTYKFQNNAGLHFELHF